MCVQVLKQNYTTKDRYIAGGFWIKYASSLKKSQYLEPINCTVSYYLLNRLELVENKSER